MEDDIPLFPQANMKPCDEDESIPPLIIATNLYGELHCTRCCYTNGASTCNQIFAKQVETGYQVPIWHLDESVRDRIEAVFREAA